MMKINMKKNLKPLIAAIFISLAVIFLPQRGGDVILDKSRLLSELLYSKNERLIHEGAASLIDVDDARLSSGVKDVIIAQANGDVLYPLSLHLKKMYADSSELFQRQKDVWIHTMPFSHGVIRLIWNTDGEGWKLWAVFLIWAGIFGGRYLVEFFKRREKKFTVDLSSTLQNSNKQLDKKIIKILSKMFGGDVYLFNSSLRLKGETENDGRHLLDMVLPDEAAALIGAVGVAEEKGMHSTSAMWHGVEKNIKIVILEDKDVLVTVV